MTDKEEKQYVAMNLKTQSDNMPEVRKGQLLKMLMTTNEEIENVLENILQTPKDLQQVGAGLRA